MPRLLPGFLQQSGRSSNDISRVPRAVCQQVIAVTIPRVWRLDDTRCSQDLLQLEFPPRLLEKRGINGVVSLDRFGIYAVTIQIVSIMQQPTI